MENGFKKINSTFFFPAFTICHFYACILSVHRIRFANGEFVKMHLRLSISTGHLLRAAIVIFTRLN